MIELDNKTRQDFLDREWVQRLLDAGVDMSDAKYALYRLKDATIDIVVYQGTFFADDRYYNGIKIESIVPTYTVSELLYKLHEWIWPTIDDVEYSGGLKVSKDAPFYFAYYDLYRTEKKQTVDGDEWVKVKGPEEFFAEFEYPIESLAGFLIQCQKKDIGIANKNIDISGK